MSKRIEYAEQVKLLIFRSAFGELEDMLASNSNLPGPRANLELAYAFADCLKAMQYIDDNLWQALNKWVGISTEDTSSGSPKEFIPFCALQALGAIFEFVDSERKAKIIEIFKAAANDLRWRVREAAAIGLQWIEEKDFKESQNIFDSWINSASLLERRTIVAALAHPPVLNDQDNVRFCFKITEIILKDLIDMGRESRKTKEFHVLRKGLEYGISVFAANLPDEGFEFMKKWARKDDPDIRKVLKSNLGKSRLTKAFGQQVNEVLSILTGNID